MIVHAPFDGEWLYVEIVQIAQVLKRKLITEPDPERSAAFAAIVVMLEAAIEISHQRAAAVN